MNYYLWISGKEEGPYSAEQIRAGIKDGSIKYNQPAHEEGSVEWTAISTIFGLKIPKKSQTKYKINYAYGKTIGPLSEDEVIAECISRKRVFSGAICRPCGIINITLPWRPIRTFPEFAKYVADMTIQDEQAEIKANLEEEKVNPHPTATCYLWRNGQQEGPFTPNQIKSMWDAGSLTADTLYYHSGLTDWHPVKGFCQNPNWQGLETTATSLLTQVVTEQKKTRKSVNAIRIGIAGIILGIIIKLTACGLWH